MRVSEAALALITRVNAQGETEYLTQWNEKWQACSLIGGHREQSESFWECCNREMEEELRLKREVDFRVASVGLSSRLEYVATSQAAGVATLYRIELFSAAILTIAAIAIIDGNADNCWVTTSEIGCGTTASGRPVAEQVGRVLNHLGREAATLRSNVACLHPASF